MTPSSIKKPYRRFLRGSLLLVVFIVLIDLLSIVLASRTAPLHAGAPTFTVCHAIPRQGVANFYGKARSERYFCSNDGCYSDRYEDLSVVGSYEDANTCAGIAEKLSNGVL